jgi:peptidoglycan/xylan/chitin deacetylase (PgdA/CDA1 family)
VQALRAAIRVTRRHGTRIRGGRATGIVLLYHRIAEGRDPLLLNVSESHFAEQLDVITSLAVAIPLREQLRGRSADRPRVTLTFDDGYADNLRVAKPQLERRDVPATVFVATATVGTRERYWWDVVAESVPDADEARRRVIELARLDRAERGRRLEELSAGVAVETPGDDRALNPDELLELADGGLVTIGAHTVNHPSLAHQSVAEQRDELRQSRAVLGEILGRPPDELAYPFGTSSDYSSASTAVAREAGYALACINMPGAVRARTDRYRVPRFLVRDWDGAEFERHLHEFSAA